MKYRSCWMIESFFLNFNGRIDTGEKCISLCCDKADVPGIAFCGSARDTMENFRRLRAELIAESVRLELLGDADEPRKFTGKCAECFKFRTGDFGRFDGLIHYVNLSMYPAPCQCKCVYCGFRSNKESMGLNKRLHADYYEKLFDVIDHAESAGLIAPDATWQVSSGEITIHPYKDRILDRVKNHAAVFYTNCFIFDEKIAANLSENPRSVINLSIDAGTPKTWREIKGVDNFDQVTDNLVKYYGNSRPGQITFKYIVLPGINNTLADYRSLVEIMKVLKIGHLNISRDTRTTYTLDTEARESLIRACGALVTVLLENGISFDLFPYSPSECEQIIAFVRELLQAAEDKIMPTSKFENAG